MNLKQPILGVSATVLVMVISLGFVSLFDYATFAGWVTFGLICLIPTSIVIDVTWGGRHPRSAASRSQPSRGILLLGVTAAAGGAVGAVYFFTIGGGIDPPAPMLVHAAIVSVPVTFCFTIMFGGWPFVRIRNPLAAGCVLLAAAYALNYALFQIFYDYGFMADAPVYAASIDPGGMFNAWSAVTFAVTSLSIMFLFLHFDLWPFAIAPRLLRQPVLGVVWTATALVLGGLVFHLGVGVMAMDSVLFMVAVPVPFIFGSIVMLKMLQASVFRNVKQPLRGLLSAGAAAVGGAILAWLYGVSAPLLAGELGSGPPEYEFEIWLASALLGVTFPFLAFSADFFRMWPLGKPDTD